MKVALLTVDSPSGTVLQALLARAGIHATVFRLPSPRLDDAVLADRVSALRQAFSQVLLVTANAPPEGARSLDVTPSLEAWLTRDPDANREALGTAEVPPPEEAARWLLAQSIGEENRHFSLSLDGLALATRLDLGLLAAFSPSFRALLMALRPNWAGEHKLERRRGRPPGVAMFRSSGYAMCLELLHRGERAEVTLGALSEILHRTRTPVLRLVQEAQRRGYLRRASAKGPLIVRDTDRLLEDMVADTKVRRAEQRSPVLSLSADRDPAGLPARLGRRLAEHGRVLALTGAAAVSEQGGDLLVGGPLLAYANLGNITPMLGDAFIDERRPQLLLMEPQEDGMLHRLLPGIPARVSPWQALIDLLASSSEREREVGAEVRRNLTAASRPR